MTTREEIKRLVDAVIDKALDSPAIDLPRAAANLMSAIDRVFSRLALVEADLKNSHACWNAACNDIAKRDERIAALEKALREYGSHKQGCYDKHQVVPRCVCGLSAALSGELK